jgi:hypothetical protein
MAVQLPPPPQPLEHQSFALGLNLRDGPDAVEQGHAINALNVRYTERGVVTARAGFERLFQVATADGVPRRLGFFEAAGELRMVVMSDRNAAVYSIGGIDRSSQLLGTVPGSIHWSWVKHGAPTQAHIFVCNGLGVARHNGTQWTLMTGIPEYGKPRVIGRSPDGRLMLAGFGSADVPTPTSGPAYPAGADRSLVVLSAPENPLSLDGDHFIRLRPGDGEDINAIVTWREQTFVFKESTFFIVGAGSPLSSGATQFPHRPVDAGVGAIGPGAAVAGRDGVYFMSPTGGIYRTTGGPPELLSDLVAPILSGVGTRYYTGPLMNVAQREATQLAWHNDQLIVSFPSGPSLYPDAQLVLDLRYGWWTVYTLPAAAVGSYGGDLWFVDGKDIGTSSREMYRQTESAISDRDAAAAKRFTARWRSGWFDFGSTLIKTLDAIRLYGAGRPVLQLSHDFRGDFAASLPSTLGGLTSTWGDGSGGEAWNAGFWGPAQAIEAQLLRRAVRGTHFSFGLEGDVGSDGAHELERWSVHRATHFVRQASGVAAMRKEA